jgi:two-component system chemotaxis response regulator CheY
MGNRILVVDDAAFMRMMIKDILTKNGFEVVAEAADGSQAVEKYKELKPDLVTMDITMRDMDGITAAKQIIGEDPNASILFLTILNDEKYKTEADKLGAKGFLNKTDTPSITKKIRELEQKQ